MNPRLFLRSLYDAAVARAQPASVVSEALPKPPRGRTVVIGAGKAAGAMALAVEKFWPRTSPLTGVVVTRYGHAPQRDSDHPCRIDILEAAHPVPDSAGVLASLRILAAVRGLTEQDLVVFLISGGASALLTLPADEIELREKQYVNSRLLCSGARIEEMNCVRKHLSRVKGGRLAAACWPAPVFTLAISDVPHDDVGVIGSGPTVPDDTSCADALEILHRYEIPVPHRVRARLEAGALETPKTGDPVFARNQVRVVAAPMHSLQAAADLAKTAGISAHVLGDAIEGESIEVGKAHAGIALSIARHGHPFARPCVVLSGGETTVTVRLAGSRVGRGGRAGEFALGLAQGLSGASNVWALAADTDGIDGVEDNAGAFVTPDTLERARLGGLSVHDYARHNDSYAFFSHLGDLLVTGPTHTNVNDFRAMLIL